MAQIKAVIESLSTILNCHRQHTLQAESFRQAKFNRSEQVGSTSVDLQ